MSKPKVPMHVFGPAILHYFQDKMVEINTGEKKTKHIMDQFEHEIKHIIRGKVCDVIGDALIVECEVGSSTKTVLVNCWHIIAIIELTDVDGTIKDVYYDDYSRSK